ncbi:ATP-binding cassette domain-containing protein [Streptomyces hydrogenans]
MIEADGLGVTFDGRPALDGVTLAVPRGGVLGLLGHNGAGKTTLVRTLTTVLPPTSGSARVAGLDVVRDAAAVRHRIGVTGQFAGVDDRLTGTENLVLVARLLGAGRAEARSRAEELLHAFGLTEAAGRRARTYSGGMRRRLDLACSLLGHPEVVFLDEPTTGLDPAARQALWDLVDDLTRDGTTVLLTTQYLEEADRLADLVTVLSQGSVVAAGTAAALKAELGHRTATLTLSRPHELPEAVEAVRRAGLRPVSEDGRITAPIGDTTEFFALVRALDAAGIAPDGLTLHEPSLDDVYLALVGPDARPPAAPDASGKPAPLKEAAPA